MIFSPEVFSGFLCRFSGGFDAQSTIKAARSNFALEPMKSNFAAACKRIEAADLIT